MRLPTPMFPHPIMLRLALGTMFLFAHNLPAHALLAGVGSLSVNGAAPDKIVFSLNYGADLSHHIQAKAVSVHPDYTGLAVAQTVVGADQVRRCLAYPVFQCLVGGSGE